MISQNVTVFPFHTEIIETTFQWLKGEHYITHSP